MTNIRTLELHYQDEDDLEIDWKRETLVNVVNDASLCNVLMSNDLRQLNLFTIDDNGELNGIKDQLIQMAHILINGLLKLNFLTFIGSLQEGKIYEKKLRDLQNSNTHSFQTEVPNTMDYGTVFVWL
jgi:hypothetical protein